MRICRILLIAGILAMMATPRAMAGKLDLDIYAAFRVLPREPSLINRVPNLNWTPGDPRDLRGESPWVQHLSHVGYAGLGIAGLVGSVATGGVAPAVGFGVITLWQLWEERKLQKITSQPTSSMQIQF